MWQRAWAKAVLALTLALAVLAPGCARPAPRPEAALPPAEIARAVADVATRESGAGQVAAVVMEQRALIAIQMEAAQPGGTDGQPLTGTVIEPDERKLSDPGKGPPDLHGPGGSVGFQPATPGGGIHPGGSAPGGGPVRTQAAPGGSGGPAHERGINTPIPAPGSMGSSAFDVMQRVANRVKTHFPAITDVRFAHEPADARRVGVIAEAIGAGQALATFRDELEQIYARSAPAGVTEFDPMSPPPAHNPVSPGPSGGGRPPQPPPPTS